MSEQLDSKFNELKEIYSRVDRISDELAIIYNEYGFGAMIVNLNTSGNEIIYRTKFGYYNKYDEEDYIKKKEDLEYVEPNFNNLLNANAWGIFIENDVLVTLDIINQSVEEDNGDTLYLNEYVATINIYDITGVKLHSLSIKLNEEESMLLIPMIRDIGDNKKLVSLGVTGSESQGISLYVEKYIVYDNITKEVLFVEDKLRHVYYKSGTRKKTNETYLKYKSAIFNEINKWFDDYIGRIKKAVEESKEDDEDGLWMYKNSSIVTNRDYFNLEDTKNE